MRITSILSLSLVTLAVTFSSCGNTENQLDDITTEILNQKEFAVNDLVHDEVDQLPMPEGGFQNYYQFIAENLKYPEAARKAGIEGKVMIQFIIAKDGSMTNVEAIKGIHAECDLAAAQTIAKSAKWSPGIKDGKTVNTRLVLPVSFQLD